MKNKELEIIINNKLNTNISIQDYIPNGLQIEGKKYIKNIITGVSACQKLLDFAVKLKADAIIVHHGYFWKNESSVIKGAKKKKISTILINNINLYSWHLPLDLNQEIGNNIYLANILNINIKGKINPFVFYGYLKNKISIKKFLSILKKKLKRIPLHFGENAPKKIYKIAWCSGAGQKFLEKIINYDIDVFLTGEVSEMNFHFANENKIHFISAGHHATEKGGVIMLGNWLKKKFKLNVNFININNPV
ncbi:Nif3-like dinuclear metal center hexameric protein [Enterobacteriaceae endosymbiont of Donacia bicoloricornis]|uniref:Nif3-like dinuclear metal center hexameric protein n=1 Tax=Enterobacteriaceae endosymbiont of Donacia bicoloricornis TaxID=2675772 RepID=UPI0014497D29|nr:Nif3-like dinuclear metal center hexameric protein [Enterobacteriaceae endosymbiont of Donacia bicoloricornis]QJC37949.1 Nif3-like dinuclear metal center hexameric protein [Enterobacteriaceae endosymbiont of Donacia bicoloricornis]